MWRNFFFCWRILLISRFSMKFSLLSMCNSPPMDRIGPQMGITPHLISSPQKPKNCHMNFDKYYSYNEWWRNNDNVITARFVYKNRHSQYMMDQRNESVSNLCSSEVLASRMCICSWTIEPWTKLVIINAKVVAKHRAAAIPWSAIFMINSSWLRCS